jgi:N-glycosylase/DNA lyase
MEFLLKIYGIGYKVANCITLYGLHYLEAFPIDIWMKKIIKKYYNGNFDIGKFYSFAGVLQQYMFFYERSLSGKIY